MDKIDKLIEKARQKNAVLPYADYDYSRLTTEELLELISEDITDERMNEILEPVKTISRQPEGYDEHNRQADN